MSKFSVYDELIKKKISNSSEIYYDADMKLAETNNAIAQTLEEYDLPEMIVRAELVVDASGLASKPADYFRMKKLWETDASGVETNAYQYIQPEEFDKIAPEAAFYWTEDYVVADAERKLKIAPASSGTIDIRYIKSPTVMTDNDSESGLSSMWDEAIAYRAAARLFIEANRYDEADKYEQLAQSRIMKLFGVLKNPGGVKGGPRIRSKWDRVSYLGGFRAGNYDNKR